MNSFVQIQLWEDDHSILIQERPYKSSDTQLNLYHMEAGCYQAEIDGVARDFCVQENSALYMSYVTVAGISRYDQQHLLCYALDTRSFDKNCINDTCFSEAITNAFLYRNIHFVKTEDSIRYCAKDFKHCSFLYNTEKEILCGTSNGLAFQDGEILQLR